MASSRSYRWLHVVGGLLLTVIFVSCGDSTPKKNFGLDLPLIKRDAEVKKDGVPYDASLLPKMLGNPSLKQRFALVNGRDMTVEFCWRDNPGHPEGTALLLEAARDHDPLFQVFSREDRPFVRSGLLVALLEAGVKYHLIIKWLDEETLLISMVQPNTRAVMIQTQVSTHHADLLLAVGLSIEDPRMRLDLPVEPAFASL